MTEKKYIATISGGKDSTVMCDLQIVKIQKIKGDNMQSEKAEKIIEENNQMHKMVCTCNRLGICQRCVREMSLPEEIVEVAEKVIDNHYDKENKCNQMDTTL